jgi:hypothetical protein
MAEPTNELLRLIQADIALTDGLQETRGRAGNREVQMAPPRACGSSAMK